MAKVLKFGLMLDDCNVRSLEGLQEHFVIEDVLKYFEDGTLSRWLKVWGYKEQLAAVEAIDKALDKKDIVLQLANIFGIEDVDAADIEKALSVFSYLDKKQKFQVTVQGNALFKKQAVEEYLAGYEALIQDMINKASEQDIEDPDIDVFKEDVQKLEQDYLPLVKLSFSELYFRLRRRKSAKAIFCMSRSNALKKLFKRCPACVKEDYERLKELEVATEVEELDSINSNATKAEEVAVMGGEDIGRTIYRAIHGASGSPYWNNKDCYITTATCEEYGKSDNCYELTMFRSFRDSWLRKQPDGEQLIKRYYATAPALVELINKQPNRRAIYRHLNEAYLSKCLRYIEDGENVKCKELYVDMVEFLYGEQQKWQN